MTKTDQITVRVTHREISSLRELAARRAVRISEVVRSALAHEINQAEPHGVFGRLLHRFTSPSA
jgi:hypothetical protein